jgi:glycosyltransferase involved in cell wall biosynthesis
VTGAIETLWGWFPDSRTGPGYKVTALPVRFGGRPSLSLLAGLDRVAHTFRPTHVHIETEPWQGISFQGLRVARRHGARVGVHFAENGPRLAGVSGLVRTTLGGAVLRRCDYAVGWSSAGAAVARTMAPEVRVDVMPATGIPRASLQSSAVVEDPTRWFGAECRGCGRIAFLGRLEDEKGYRDFLEVSDRVAGSNSVRVAIAGSGSGDLLVERWAASRDFAHTHGVVSRDEATSLLRCSDVLVCPSRTTRHLAEQFGKAAAEAMAVGTPVFGYDCGSLSEVIRDGGAVVPEGDVEALASEVSGFLRTNPAARKPLVEAARRSGARFAEDVLAEHLVRLWRGVDRYPQLDTPSVSINYPADAEPDPPRQSAV